MKPLSAPLNLRVFQDDIDRLDRLAAILPMPKSAIAREALHRGLTALEEAAPKFAEKIEVDAIITSPKPKPIEVLVAVQKEPKPKPIEVLVGVQKRTTKGPRA